MSGVIEAVARELDARLPGAVTRDAPAADLVTYRTGGPIAVLVRVSSDRALDAVARIVSDARPDVAVIGRGSNLLVADAGFNGVVVVLEGEFEALDVATTSATAGGAVALPVLARRTAAAGRTGLEFYVGIPGSVGGAVRMNAGGHGRETVEVLQEATVVDLTTAARWTVRVDELDLGYRTSNVAATQVVTAAVFTVAPADPEVCTAQIDEIVRWRRDHQPGGANAGSIFRNPEGDSAGRIIDALGLKGFRVGGVSVSEKHANFMQAEPGATAADVAALVDAVRRRVADATGTWLVPELQLLGFEPSDQHAGGAR